jgi:hypothetical protein
MLSAVMGAASTAPAASPPPHAAQRPGHPVLVDCFWHPQVRPADFILACGDGNSRLSSLHWSRWGQDAAVATGVNEVNDCKPYCAAGRFHSYPVVVLLDQPQSWKEHPRLRHYTRVSLVYTDARPDGSGRVVSYPL